MLDVLRKRLATTREVSLYVTKIRCCGLGLVVDDFSRFLDTGGRIRILTSIFMSSTQPEALKQIARMTRVDCRYLEAEIEYNPFSRASGGQETQVYIFKNDHAECWSGPAHLTKAGLALRAIDAQCYRDLNTTDRLEQEFQFLWDHDEVRQLTPEVAVAYELHHHAKAFGGLGHSQLPAKVHEDFTFQTVSSDLSQQSEASRLLDTSDAPSPNFAQTEALMSLERLRAVGEVRAAVIAAPGIGKTYLAAFDARASEARTLLFISHRLEHLAQAERTFRRVFGESRSYCLVHSGLVEASADFVFATVQSASRNDLILNRSFDYMVIDEFHHAEAPSYERTIHRTTTTFLLGLTATPERQDGHDVLRLCDYNVAYEVRLVQAINRGWLVPFHYFGVCDSVVDYGAIPWRSGRFDISSLENALMLEDRVDEIIRHAESKGFDGLRRATVGFCAGVRHARFMADMLCRRGLTAVTVTGEDSLEYREEIYRRFEDPSDPLEWIFVADVLNEGVDIPSINSLLFLRPTESATVFIQQLGRGLRKSADCSVLTVIDFVGHHRSAWISVATLQDQDAGEGASRIAALDYSPPQNCEVILEQRTLEILEKIRRHTEPNKNQCLNAYSLLRSEAERPYPLDLWGREDCPELGVFRKAFGSWIGLRIAAKDSESWEEMLDIEGPTYKFLCVLERDWQQARVYAYALLWGLCVHPRDEPTVAYDLFFERFPRWKVEYKALANTKAWDTVQKRIGTFIDPCRLGEEIRAQIPVNRISCEVEGRIRLTLERDFKLRHCGHLRTPDDLRPLRYYSRAEILNHFERQYDPAVHNVGVVTIGVHVIIITKLDTRSARQGHQYSNGILGETTFAWQSQNRQRQDNEEGRLIIDHRINGKILHLFVQTRASEKACYYGTVSVQTVSENAPMNVVFQLNDRSLSLR